MLLSKMMCHSRPVRLVCWSKLPPVKRAAFIFPQGGNWKWDGTSTQVSVRNPRARQAGLYNKKRTDRYRIRPFIKPLSVGKSANQVSWAEASYPSRICDPYGSFFPEYGLRMKKLVCLSPTAFPRCPANSLVSSCQFFAVRILGIWSDRSMRASSLRLHAKIVREKTIKYFCTKFQAVNSLAHF